MTSECSRTSNGTFRSFDWWLEKFSKLKKGSYVIWNVLHEVCRSLSNKIEENKKYESCFLGFFFQFLIVAESLLILLKPKMKVNIPHSKRENFVSKRVEHFRMLSKLVEECRRKKNVRNQNFRIFQNFQRTLQKSCYI